jgi:hypothetical protein
MPLSHFTPTDLSDLRRSGLSDTMIQAMCLEPSDRNTLVLRLDRSDLESHDSGYVIPYFTKTGEKTKSFNVRLHVGIAKSDTDPTKRMKYCKPPGTDNLVYFPPGFQALYEKFQYVIITEGEKKAAKAVQDGFPCVAIGGVWNWFDNAMRNSEKLEGLKISYRTRPLDTILQMAFEKKIILMFDSDAANNPQVNAALRVFSDALLYHGNGWVRGTWVPAPDDTKKYGIDDYLMLQNGPADLMRMIEQELSKISNYLTPLLKIQYAFSADNKPLHYIVPNSAKGAKMDVHQIVKQVEIKDADGANHVVAKTISSTRLWVYRVVHSIDDDSIMYNMAYIPLANNDIRYLSGSSEVITLSGRNGGDLYSDRGAPILTKEKPFVEEFFHACQVYGVRQGVVKRVAGTRRRGWVEHSGDLLYLMPNRVFTRSQTYAASSRDIPLLPIDSGPSDYALQEAMRPGGDFATWKSMMLHGVLPNTVPTLYMVGALAGLLRYWCPDSENFILHLYNDSSSGKTTALRAAAGLWGNPARLIDMWRTTDNGLEGRCLARNDMMILLDEAGMVGNEDIIKNSVYMIGNGGEKMRASRDGGERRTRMFRLIALSTGERGLLRGERHAGQEVRVLEIPTHVTGKFWENSISNAAEAERLNGQLLEHYGFAADKAIQYIQQGEHSSAGIWRKLHVSFTENLRKSLPVGTPPHILRRVKHYGLLLTALTVFLRGVMEMSADDAAPFVERVRWDIARYMLSMASDQFTGGERVGMLEHFINAMATNQITHFHAEDDARGEVWGSFNLKDSLVTTANILPAYIGKLCAPYDQTRIIGLLDSIGALTYNKTRKDKKTSVRIQNHVTSCYQIQVDIVRRHLEDHYKNVNNPVDALPDAQSAAEKGSA